MAEECEAGHSSHSLYGTDAKTYWQGRGLLTEGSQPSWKRMAGPWIAAVCASFIMQAVKSSTLRTWWGRLWLDRWMKAPHTHTLIIFFIRDRGGSIQYLWSQIDMSLGSVSLISVKMLMVLCYMMFWLSGVGRHVFAELFFVQGEQDITCYKVSLRGVGRWSTYGATIRWSSAVCSLLFLTYYSVIVSALHKYYAKYYANIIVSLCKKKHQATLHWRYMQSFTI